MTPNQQHISILLEQCKSGNQHAQMEVYNRYFKAMYNTSLRIVKDNFSAEDIMQDSFLTAFSKLETLKDFSMFGPWLKRIVVNNSISYYHKNSKYNEVRLDDVLYTVEDSQGIVEDYEWTTIKAAQIVECMKCLKENYQLALPYF
ncbi:RNA polymerase sigma factor [Gelidibacter mesophilus]|uniref:RNA polymerase sigma factor n=1 Tax=Gelidibacter mesophilus TaxID=169050 RepID=UPI00041C6E24